MTVHDGHRKNFVTESREQLYYKCTATESVSKRLYPIYITHPGVSSGLDERGQPLLSLGTLVMSESKSTVVDNAGAAVEETAVTDSR